MTKRRNLDKFMKADDQTADESTSEKLQKQRGMSMACDKGANFLQPNNIMQKQLSTVEKMRGFQKNLSAKGNWLNTKEAQKLLSGLNVQDFGSARQTAALLLNKRQLEEDQPPRKAFSNLASLKGEGKSQSVFNSPR